MPQEQMVEQPVRKKRKGPPKLEFDAGMVFDVKGSNIEVLDDQLDVEMARYHANHGQAGDRLRQGNIVRTVLGR